MTIIGSASGVTGTPSLPFTLIVQPAPFLVTLSQATQSVSPGVVATYTISATGQPGFTGPISLGFRNPQSSFVEAGFQCAVGQSLTAATAGISDSVSPGGQATAQVSVTVDFNGGLQHNVVCDFLISASGGGSVQLLNAEFVVTPFPEFTVSAPAPQTVMPPASGSVAVNYTVSVTPTAGFTGPVSFTTGALPPGVTVDAIPQLTTFPNAVGVTAHVPAGLAARQYQFTIIATGPSGAPHNVSAILNVTQGTDFSLSVMRVQTIQQGQSAAYTIALNPIGGFTGGVSLNVGAITGGVSAGLSSTTLSAGAPVTLTLSAASNATLGAYSILVNAANGSVGHAGIAPLIVTLGATTGPISLGTIGLQANGPATTVPLPAMPANETVVGCVAPAGVTTSIGTLPGSATQMLSIAASSQASASGTLTCTTSAGRSITALERLGFGTLFLEATRITGSTFDINLRTVGFEEADTVILYQPDGTEQDGEGSEDGEEVDDDFQVEVAPAQCLIFYGYVWGVGNDEGTSAAIGAILVCNGAPAPSVTISCPLGIAQGGADACSVAVSSGNTTAITLTIATSTGSGSATFADGTASMTITSSQTVMINGAATSSTAGNITLAAAIDQQTLASQTFSVVSVSITLNANPPSDDDTAVAQYMKQVTSQGPFGPVIYQSLTANYCAIGVELVGIVSPSNYTGVITLRRNTDTASQYNGSNLTTIQPKLGPDNSSLLVEVTNPQPHGHVYDLDASGVGGGSINGVPVVERVRYNFTEFALLGDQTSKQRVGSSFSYYARVSCTVDANGNQVFSNTVAGDNQAGPGTTSLSWNLQ
jgi:hypothetical protein